MSLVQVVLAVMALTLAPKGVVVTVCVAITSMLAACVMQGISAARASRFVLVVKVDFMDSSVRLCGLVMVPRDSGDGAGLPPGRER